MAQSAQNALRRPNRLKWHIGLMLLLALTVFIGSGSASSEQSLLASASAPTNTTTNIAPLVNPSATVYIAAAVATKLNLPMAAAVNRQATTLAATALSTTVDTQSRPLTKPGLVSTPGAARHSIINYVVQPHDTLNSIASRFGLDTATIINANNGNGGAIKPGQTLKILPVDGVSYTVASGDNARSIASKFKADASLITIFNDLETSPLVPGRTIIIPGGIKPAPVPVINSVISFFPNFSSGNTYDPGFCTWYVKNLRPDIPNGWGDASNWFYAAQATGFSTSRSVPRVGAVAYEVYRNHVAYVTAVHGGTITITEMNHAGQWVTDTRIVDTANWWYIY